MAKDTTAGQHPSSTECCCNCRWHAADLSHPCTDGGRLSHQRGWVCLAPEFDHAPSPVLIGSERRVKAVVSGFPEHGMCEMHKRAVM